MQQWTGDVIRDIRNHAPTPAGWCERLKINGERIAVNEDQLARTNLRGKLVLQARDQIVVELHSNHVGAARKECLGQESETRTDLKDQLSCGWCTSLHDTIANIQIVQEVLAEALLGGMAVNASTARCLAILWTHAGTAAPIRHCA